MIEQRERSFNPIARIQRNPGYLGARLLLATIMASGTACASETAARTTRLRCPETTAEVSFLVGGDPRNWRAQDFNKGSWFYEGSDDSTVFNAARIGRIDVPNRGRVTIGFPVQSKTAWYVCPESLSIPEQDNTPDSTPSPI